VVITGDSLDVGQADDLNPSVSKFSRNAGLWQDRHCPGILECQHNDDRYSLGIGDL